MANGIYRTTFEIGLQHAKTEKRYRAIEAAKATGLSEGIFTSFFSNREESIKYGMTLEQIVRVLTYTPKNNGRVRIVKWDDVAEIRARLADEHGIFCWDEYIPQENTNAD